MAAFAERQGSDSGDRGDDEDDDDGDVFDFMNMICCGLTGRNDPSGRKRVKEYDWTGSGDDMVFMKQSSFGLVLQNMRKMGSNIELP